MTKLMKTTKTKAKIGFESDFPKSDDPLSISNGSLRSEYAFMTTRNWFH